MLNYRKIHFRLIEFFINKTVLIDFKHFKLLSPPNKFGIYHFVLVYSPVYKMHMRIKNKF